MKTINECLSFCKDKSNYHAKKAVESGIKPFWATKHLESEEYFHSLVNHLEHQQSTTSHNLLQSPDKEIQRDLFALSPFDLDDLPPDVIDELKLSKADTADFQIVELLKIAGKPLSINEILAGLYRKFEVSTKRTALSARLYRMSQANIIEQFEDERGVYTLPKKSS